MFEVLTMASLPTLARRSKRQKCPFQTTSPFDSKCSSHICPPSTMELTSSGARFTSRKPSSRSRPGWTGRTRLSSATKPSLTTTRKWRKSKRRSVCSWTRQLICWTPEQWLSTSAACLVHIEAHKIVLSASLIERLTAVPGVKMAACRNLDAVQTLPSALDRKYFRSVREVDL